MGSAKVLRRVKNAIMDGSWSRSRSMCRGTQSSGDDDDDDDDGATTAVVLRIIASAWKEVTGLTNPISELVVAREEETKKKKRWEGERENGDEREQERELLFVARMEEYVEFVGSVMLRAREKVEREMGRCGVVIL